MFLHWIFSCSKYFCFYQTNFRLSSDVRSLFSDLTRKICWKSSTDRPFMRQHGRPWSGQWVAAMTDSGCLCALIWLADERVQSQTRERIKSEQLERMDGWSSSRRVMRCKGHLILHSDALKFVSKASQTWVNTGGDSCTTKRGERKRVKIYLISF